ncbi:MAG: GTP-binding protein [Rhodobacteraceae bacterium]|nr:GTP-binding protein [Paracoccaceae bacterium]
MRVEMNTLRAPAATDRRLPVTLLTGFLGAGKTTCLNAFMQSPEAADTAVLVNEFGAIDVDGAVLSARLGIGSRVITLPNGCVCCAVQENLAEALLALTERRLGSVARCIVETTGLADPGAILRGVGHDARLRRTAVVDRIVTVCAADRIGDQLDRFAEPQRQIGLADRIVVSKADLATGAQRAAALGRIGAINPLADIRVAVLGGADPGALFGEDGLGLHRLTATTAAHHHSHAVRSFAVRTGGPLDPDRFRDVMSFLIMRHAESLLRIKGVVRIAGDAEPRLVNGVHDVFASEPIAEAAAPQGEGGFLVFIGVDLPEAAIRADLASCAGTP